MNSKLKKKKKEEAPLLRSSYVMAVNDERNLVPALRSLETL